MRDAEPDYETAGGVACERLRGAQRKSRIRHGLANIRNAIGFVAVRDIGRFAPRYTRISPATP
ncbi:hypothetical protein A8E97_23340 [Burkholderia cenocepacia]|uniref:hypothetical protein n=1 Tax=Burkholderia sp. E168m30 TaxID=1561201 RepID=UPI0006D3F611|nr:hypothetical protein [Burkholderia sp. E168m30]AQQ25899.1 hypothetical protein A8E88_09615 [Burkholderia cenocepacia]ONV88638.1 hypothetical protein A8E89_18745 [Burkholderia cenocepacia]ONW09897.1 hypothetical protein A8E94_22640 [Burkholderia cenocepacia]ONW17446.1 hypothetical protein A8E90_16130 [Burkholderia cenocepacia]ONW36795.1 hypothetical protein A8E93_23035 [Burkholderia cenocepacia]